MPLAIPALIFTVISSGQEAPPTRASGPHSLFGTLSEVKQAAPSTHELKDRYGFMIIALPFG